MAKRYFTVEIGSHGLIWWLAVGWWYRPAKYVFWGAVSTLCGFRKIEIVKRKGKR